MNRFFQYLIIVTAALVSGSFAKDTDKADKAPSGYFTMDEMDKAQAKAKASKKLIAVLVKGSNDNCPHCVAAMSNGQSALRGDCVMVFTRAGSVMEKASSLSGAAKSGLSGCPDGAAVTFVVFDPELQEVVAKMGRDELETDRKAVGEMKKTVAASKKKLFP